MRISSIESTDLFTGTRARPLQILRVTVTGNGQPSPPGGEGTPGQSQLAVRADGPGVRTPDLAVIGAPGPGADAVAEVGVQVAAPARPGSVRHVTVAVRQAGPGGGPLAEAPAETGRLRVRPRVPRADGRRRPGHLGLGPRAVPPVGPAADRGDPTAACSPRPSASRR